MAVNGIYAENWKQYSRPARIASTWLSNVTLSSTAWADFETVGTRRMFRFGGGLIARMMTPRRRVCASFVARISQSATNGLSFGLLPQGSGQVLTNNVFAVQLKVSGATLQFIRNSWNNTTKAVGSTIETVDLATLFLNQDYHFEIMIDHTDAGACRAHVYLNTSLVLDRTYAAANGSFTNADAFASYGIYTGSNSGNSRPMVSDVYIYDTDAPGTDFPRGVRRFENLSVEAALPFPPSDTDAPLEITGTSWAQWELGDSVATSDIEFAVGFVNLEAGVGLETVHAEIEFRNGSNLFGSYEEDIPPGLERVVREVPITPVPTKAQLDAMQFRVRRS